MYRHHGNFWSALICYYLLALIVVFIIFVSILLRPKVTLIIILAATLFVLYLTFLNEKEIGTPRTLGLIKLACELPLGLGAIVAYGYSSKGHAQEPLSLSSSSTALSLSSSSCAKVDERESSTTLSSWWFPSYVNVAVLGNIVMMIAVPTGGTLRGQLTKCSCSLLTLWLYMCIRQRGWFHTVEYGSVAKQLLFGLDFVNPKGRIFLFTASPLPWILVHAVYRAVLVTLPSFDTWKYLILEPLSLTFTVLFYFALRYRNRSVEKLGDFSQQRVVNGVPIEYCFGASDTLVVSVLGTLSTVVDDLDWFPQLRHPLFVAGSTSDHNFEKYGAYVLDVCLAAVQLLVCISAAIFILRRFNNTDDFFFTRN